jgi:hypothetical protein
VTPDAAGFMLRTLARNCIGNRHGDEFGDRHDPDKSFPSGVAVTRRRQGLRCELFVEHRYR